MERTTQSDHVWGGRLAPLSQITDLTAASSCTRSKSQHVEVKLLFPACAVHMCLTLRLVAPPARLCRVKKLMAFMNSSPYETCSGASPYCRADE
jgi:hypothetical protein